MGNQIFGYALKSAFLNSSSNVVIPASESRRESAR